MTFRAAATILSALLMAGCGQDDAEPEVAAPVTVTVTETASAEPLPAELADCEAVADLLERTLAVMTSEAVEFEAFVSAMGASNEMRDLAEVTTSPILAEALLAYSGEIDMFSEAAADGRTYDTAGIVEQAQIIGEACA